MDPPCRGGVIDDTRTQPPSTEARAVCLFDVVVCGRRILAVGCLGQKNKKKLQ